MLLDSIAAAVESQTIITCEQLRNISNLKHKGVRGRGKIDLVVMKTKTDLQRELPGT